MGLHPNRYAVSTAEAGRSRVWCGGLCMTGPDYKGTIFSFLLATAIFVTECAVSFPWLLPNKPILAIPLLTIMLASFIIAISAAYLASTTDPGIIPRSDTAPNSIIAFPMVRERIVTYLGRHITMKYCDTCKIWRPPRSSHCATCNNCVRRFDHHCPWLGNDVGLRNYRSYFTLIVSASIFTSVAIVISVLTIHFTSAHFRTEFPQDSYGSSIHRALRSNGTSVNIALVLICFLALLFTGGLTGFHILLMFHNVTTAESFKKRARNSTCDDDDRRGWSAMYMLQCTNRQKSALTNTHYGPAYPEEQELTILIDKQVAEEQVLHNSISPPVQAARYSNSDHQPVP